eukprot:3941200-Rhodomonas_salina.2
MLTTAHVQIAMCYLEGRGTRKDAREGVAFLGKAAYGKLLPPLALQSPTLSIRAVRYHAAAGDVWYQHSIGCYGLRSTELVCAGTRRCGGGV